MCVDSGNMILPDDHLCDACGEPIFYNFGIYLDDEYYEIGDKIFHKDCVGEVDVYEILELLQISPKTGFDDGRE